MGLDYGNEVVAFLGNHLVESRNLIRRILQIGIHGDDNIVEVPFDKEHLLERIISPDNLLKAYKAVQRNRGCSGIVKGLG